MLLIYVALLCFLQSSFGVELFIYKSFTEVRQVCTGMDGYSSQFRNTDYGNIIEGSISWMGTPLIRQEIYNTIQSLRDAHVKVQRSTMCACETIEAKIVDTDSMLLQNLNTGAYFYADKQSIEYTSVQPKEDRTTLSLQFQTENTQYNGTLSYLMKGITWKPTYDLFLTGNGNCKLLAYANIKNDQQIEYKVELTHLLGCDVPLATSYSDTIHALEVDRRPTNMKPIQIDGEQKGIYSYSLNDKYTMRPLSSIRLSFIDIGAKYQFYYKAIATISTGIYQDIFEKTYDITPDHFMPAGIITILDNNMLVGQVSLPDVSENYTQTFTVSHDNDVRYSIKGNLTAKNNENAPKSFETSDMDFNIMNFKNKNINTQFIFQSGIQIMLHETTCKFASVQGNQLNLLVQLNQREQHQCKFSVTVQLN